MRFAVIRQGGPSWDPRRGLREQDGWSEHAAFMDALQEERFVLLGGPLGTGTAVDRALLIIEADSETTIRTRLAADPWALTRFLEIVSVEPWNVLLGRLPSQ
jgi:uncharacterized protein YciI